jgi:hypothetical protein
MGASSANRDSRERLLPVSRLTPKASEAFLPIKPSHAGVYLQELAVL